MSIDKNLEELKKENQELLNNWKRAVADLENFKKRKQSESKELLEYAKEMTVLQLIPSLQSLEQVLSFAPSDNKYKDWLQGLNSTIIQLENTMASLGVNKIPTINQVFDPTRHEAVSEIEHEKAEIIVEEVQPGFTLNGKVIIPAKVIVGKVLKDHK
ncbi:MAG: nucleotide exchange factor GrpE [bacterium]|nr:nucleotide exchange factor GrpE [bacterium]